MDILFQRHCAKYIYVVPEGLRELMSDISREVLRTQPEHIYTFIADYLDALMITRENARVAARFVESMTEVGVTIADLLIRTGMTREEADAVATIIQLAFRKHLAEKQKLHRPEEDDDEERIIARILEDCNITMEQAEEATTIIQNAYRAFKKREEQASDLLKGMVDWRVAARSTLRLYRRTGVTYEEANKAATLIKAAYKGYYTRRIMKRLLEESESVTTEMKSYDTLDLDLTAEQEASYADELFKSIERDDGREEGTSPMKGAPDDTNVALYIMDALLNRVIPPTPSASATSLVIPHPSLADVIEEPAEEASAAETPASEAPAPEAPAPEAPAPDAPPESAAEDQPTDVIKEDETENETDQTATADATGADATAEATEAQEA